MSRFVFDNEVYNSKAAFIQKYCLDIKLCRLCKQYNPDAGCTHPEHPNKSIMKDIEKPEYKLKSNHVFFGYDDTQKKYRIKLMAGSLEKTVGFTKTAASAKTIAEFILQWSQTIDTELEYSKMKNALEYFRKDYKIK
jgi:hypothetical protein